jgi:uracil-DNA glycosylase family 4
VIQKPGGCAACPLFDDGQGFAQDEIVEGAQVLVLLQNPGENEERDGRPAVGKTGELLNDRLLPAARLKRGLDVSVANVLRCRWRNPKTGNKTNDLPVGDTLTRAVSSCRQYDNAGDARVVLAAGALAWKATGQSSTISEWRGYKGQAKFLGLPVIGTLHPADLFHDPKMLLAMQTDFRKAVNVLNGTFPQPFPKYVAEAKPEDVRRFIEQCIEQSVEYVVVDTEFARSNKRLEMLGMGAPSVDGVQVDFSKVDGAAWPEIGDLYRQLVKHVPIVFQNCLADIPVLQRAFGVRYEDYVRIDDTMLAHAPLWSEWPHSLEFLASIYSPHNKTKHLAKINPSVYNAGDFIDTGHVWEGLKRELDVDAQTKAIYESQSLALVPILLRSKAYGIRVNKPRVWPLLQDYRQRVEESARIAQAALGWPINLSSPLQLQNYFYTVAELPGVRGKRGKVGSVDGDVLASWRAKLGFDTEYDDDGTINRVLLNIEAGSDPVLEARVAYAAIKQALSHYLEPLIDSHGNLVDRIYPEIKIHAQASGRWSITDPPLAQLPDDLRDLICPDVGEAWISWDWEAIELRILAALTGDQIYLEALAKSWDVHTVNACAVFDLPVPEDKVHPHAELMRTTDWLGKEDIRRTFTKRLVYRLHYRGEPKTAGDIPGAKQLGLSAPKLVEASNRYLRAHPAIVAYWKETDKIASETREIRTWAGRRRRLLGEGRGVLREASNHPLQGGVADILNLTTVAIARRLPKARLVSTMHDSAVWAVPEAEAVTAERVIREEAEREWPIAGGLVIPAKFKQVVRGEVFGDFARAA